MPQSESLIEREPFGDSTKNLQANVEAMRRDRFEYLVRFAGGKEENRSLSYVQDALRTVYLVDLKLEEPNRTFAQAHGIETKSIPFELESNFTRIFTREILKYPPVLFRRLGSIRSLFVERLYQTVTDGSERKVRNLYGLAYASSDGGDGYKRRVYMARDVDRKKGTDQVRSVEDELSDTIHHELLHLFFRKKAMRKILGDYWDKNLRPDAKIFFIKFAKHLHLIGSGPVAGFFNDYSLSSPREQVAVVTARLMANAKEAYRIAINDRIHHQNSDLFIQLNTIEGAFNVYSKGLMDDIYFRLLQNNNLPLDYWLKRPESW